MSGPQCPVCYGPLDARDVTPCVVCGGWPESVARFDPGATFTAFRLPDGRPLVLCPACELEEFMVPGGVGERLIPGERLPANGLVRTGAVPARLLHDRFCETCHLRLALLKLLAAPPTGERP